MPGSRKGSPGGAASPERGPAPAPGRWAWLAPAAWDAASATSPAATFFHSRAWSEAIAATDPRYTARALGYGLASGATAVLPLALRGGVWRRGPLGRAVSTQPGTYGGPLVAGRRLTEAEWEELVRALDRAPLGRIDCFGNLLDPLPPRLAEHLGATERETHRIELPALPENPRSTYRKGCKHALTKAERAGVRCVGDADGALLPGYLEVYEDSLRRWGRPREKGYSAAFLGALAALPGAELWCAVLPDGLVVAGGIFLFTPALCVWWHGAMSAAHVEAAPSNALIHALVQEARARGCRWFDFNPSGGHEGVASFKSSFRAELTPFHVWTHLSPLVRRVRRRP